MAININLEFERIGKMLSEERWSEAIAICDKLLEEGYDFPEIYQARLLAEAEAKSFSSLKESTICLEDCYSYRKVISVSDEELANYVKKCNELSVKKYMEKSRKLIQEKKPKANFLDLNNTAKEFEEEEDFEEEIIGFERNSTKSYKSAKNQSGQHNNMRSRTMSDEIATNKYGKTRKYRSNNSKNKIILGAVVGLATLILMIVIIKLVMTRTVSDDNKRGSIGKEQLFGSDSNVYDQTDIKDLSTYTAITNEECVDRTEVVGGFEYKYIINNEYDQNINKYESYLSSCGLTKNPDISDDYRKIFDYHGTSLELVINSDTKHELTIFVPIADNEKETNYENMYNLAIEKYESGFDEDAFNILKELDVDYKDTLVIRSYILAKRYDEKNLYGSAIEHYRLAKGYKDSDERCEALLSEVEKYNGTYYYEAFKNLNSGYYMYVKDGKISFAFDNESENYYSDELVKMKLTTGKESLMIASGIRAFDDSSPEEDSDYSFIVNNDKSISVIRYEKSTVSTFVGIYDFISSSAPEETEL